jgi:hypothetical protein
MAMDETSVIAGEPGVDPVPPAPDYAPAQPARSVWERRVATLLLVVYLFAIGLAVPAVWARNQIFDTERFVRTVAPLAEDDDVKEAVVQRVSTSVSSAVASSDFLTEGDRDVLAAVLPAVTLNAVESVTRNVVYSPEFEPLWEDAARALHAGFEALLTGGESPYFSSENGQVAIELSPIVAKVTDELATRGINVTPQSSNLQFVLFESDELASLQSITEYIEELAIILPIVALVALVGYLLLSPNRRGALVVASLGLAVMMAAVLVFIIFDRWLYQRALDDSVNQDAATATFDILTYYLRLALRLLSLLGIVLALIFYFTRHMGVSMAGVDSVTERGWQSLTNRWPALGNIENAVARNRKLTGALLTSAVTLLLIVWDGLTINWAVVILLLGLVGLVLIRRAQPSVEVTVQAPVMQPTPAPARPAADMVGYLQELGDLKSQGLLSDEEFARAKDRLLGATP